jgi:DNA-binding response OmpR family regulator
MTGGKNTVLIVDDEPKILEILKVYLEAGGYKVIQTTEGNEALKVFENAAPDLVITDLMLPDITGAELCKLVRQKSSIPIIMLTARATEEDRTACLNMGANAYITKPFSIKGLIAEIRNILS